jgi:hypothetical protein
VLCRLGAHRQDAALKELLIDLSKNWHKLAIELERSAALLEMEDPAPVVPRRKK